MTRNTFNSGQKYRNRKLPVILDRDVGRFHRIHRRRLERSDASSLCRG